MFRYFLLCLACVGGYWLSALKGPSDGVWFFVDQSSWSFAIAGVALLLNCGRLSVIVAGIECAAILLNLVCAVQYVTAPGALYAHYEPIVLSLTALEALALLWGAPKGGICRAIRELWSLVAHRYSTAHRSALGHPRG